MNKKILAAFVLSSLLISMSSQAVVLSDTPQTSQATLNKLSSAMTVTTAQLNAANAIMTVTKNGYSGATDWIKKDKLNSLFREKVNYLADDAYNDIFKKEMTEIFGSNVSNIKGSDLLSMDTEKLKKLGESQIKSMSDNELKEILGDQLGSKLNSEKIKSLINDPKGLITLAEDLEAQKKSQGQTGLAAVGIQKDDLKDKTSQGSSAGPDGNRSDAFQGSGNGSSEQASKAKEAFEEAKEKIVDKLQLPSDPADMKELTTDKIAEVARLQEETVRELSIRGLAKTWISQTITSRRISEQEKEAAKLVNESVNDLRKAIQAVSTITIATVEMQNAASSLFAMDLAVTGAQGIEHVGHLQEAAASASSTSTTSITGSN